MNDPADTLDQTDQEILAYTVSDEALEAAAREGVRPVLSVPWFSSIKVQDGCC
jgi:hypothetical protein